MDDVLSSYLAELNATKDTTQPPTVKKPAGRGVWTSSVRPSSSTSLGDFPAFKETPGPKGAARHVATDVEAFDLFFTERMFNRVVAATNFKLARERRFSGEETTEGGDTNVAEVRCFFALLIYRGLHMDTKIDTAELFYGPYSRPFYRASMSQGRFKILKKCLAFHNQSSIGMTCLQGRDGC